MKRLSSTNCSRHGLTLIEVVAGLALMGTLLAAMLSAKSGFTRQHHHAQRVLVAVALTDALLLSHGQDLHALQEIGSGGFDRDDSLAWSVTPIDDPVAGDWHCRVVRLEVQDLTADTQAEPLVSIDLLLADAPPDAPPDAVPPTTPTQSPIPQPDGQAPVIEEQNAQPKETGNGLDLEFASPQPEAVS